MSVLALDIERPAILEIRTRPARSLDELIVRAWAALRSGRNAACPVCEGSMVPGRSMRCRDCGSTLS